MNPTLHLLHPAPEELNFLEGKTDHHIVWFWFIFRTTDEQTYFSEHFSVNLFFGVLFVCLFLDLIYLFI